MHVSRFNPTSQKAWSLRAWMQANTEKLCHYKSPEDRQGCRETLSRTRGEEAALLCWDCHLVLREGKAPLGLGSIEQRMNWLRV